MSALVRLAGVVIVFCALLAGCQKPASDPHAHEGESNAEHGHDDVARGPQGGRVFTDGDVRLELTIAEDGIPPEFRAYLSDARGRQRPPGDATLRVVLERFGGRRDTIDFHAEREFLRGMRTVEEPHSFTAHVALELEGRSHAWSYTQEEGRVELSPEAVERGEIVSAEAGPRDIEVTVDMPGEVKLDASRVSQVRPRYAGVVQRLHKGLGDAVRTGDLLAVVQSNESLSDYEIRSSMGGRVIDRTITVGQTVHHETVLYTIADLSTVWVDFALYPQVAGKVRPGQAVRIVDGADPARSTRAKVDYVGPLLEQDTRVSYGRVVLANRGSEWTPGLFVTAEIAIDRARAAVAVPEEAIVRTARGPAVFRAEGTTFELQPVVPGRSDGTWTEIVEGLSSGDRVVVRNAFLLKAELGKAGATHDH